MQHFITYNSHRIKVSTAGKGEAVLFLHGWPTNSKLWQSQVEVLQQYFKVITLDWLGFGQSDKPANHHYTFTHKKEIVDAVLKEILPNGEKINIIAHDVGGPAAVLWAHENPSRINRLVLLNTILFPFSTPLDKMSHFFFGIPLLKNVFVSSFGLKMMLQTLTQSRGKALNNRINTILETHDNWSNTLKLKTILEPMNEGRKKEIRTIAAQFKALKVSKHLIIAEKDPLCYAHMRTMQEQNPDIPSYILDNCGHFIPIDRPNELNSTLLRILEKEEV